MKKFYLRYQRNIDSFVDINIFMLGLNLFLLFVVKGSIDWAMHANYDWQGYLVLLLQSVVGVFLFFGIILVVECVRLKRKRS
ncbi:hypothetical protein [Lactiplantibacillus carotarum]|uniref:hypothetical protein n=1 Tax=Lactiplantibacillus carotarum TaxID=2993456 RepID=UPI00298EF4C3|nr:hypothetical protein [Lactiplantibacillus carotarum]